jgi:hypothetical protein
MQLFKANQQWSTRPDDESFASLDALHDACASYRDVAKVATVPYTKLAVVPVGADVHVTGPNGGSAALTHWAFGQLSARAEAPASYLRTLPAELAASNLTHGLAKRTTDETASMMFHQNGGLLCRAITSERYTRIWNVDITSRLLRLRDTFPQWQPAPAAMDGKRGLYASDHDLFAFLVDNDRRVFENANGGLSRGFFVWNSEVGAASFGVMKFLYEYVCGNHIVWGASQVSELRVRHIGDADTRAWRELATEIRRYADSSVSDDEARIEATRRCILGADKDAVLDKIFGLRIPVLSRKRADDAYQAAEAHVDWYGDPRSAWGIANGITELARALPYTDERVAMDRAAGKVLSIAF